MLAEIVDIVVHVCTINITFNILHVNKDPNQIVVIL